MLGVSLSGGGMKCAAHLGVLQEMVEQGVPPDLIAGSSMGAVVGALYATRGSLAEAADQLCRIRMADVFIGGVPVPGLNHGNRLYRLTQHWFGNFRVEHLRVPLLIATCDLNTGETHWIDHGSLGDALYATCAFPGFFAPFRWENRLLADGWITEPLPITALRARGAKKVVGVRFPSPERPENQGTLPAWRRTLEIVWQRLAQNASVGADLMIQPAIATFNGFWWNEATARAWAEIGRTAARRALPALHGLMRELRAPTPIAQSFQKGGSVSQ